MSTELSQHYYIIYGLCLQVNTFVSGLITNQFLADEIVDVRVTLGAFPDIILDLLAGERFNYHISPWYTSTGNPYLTVDTLADGTYFYFKYDEGVQFVCDKAATEVWGTWSENLTLQDATVYLVGPILGFMLRLRGTICLHASSITVGNHALAIVGVSGAGKSTTAAALAARGYPVVTDDVLPLADLGNTFQAIPGYPRLRLWPHAVETLYGRPDAQPLLTPTWTKRYLDLNDSAYTFKSNPTPLHAIYIIDQRNDNSAAPFIEPVPRANGLFALASYTYRNELLDKTMRQQEFGVLGRLVTQVPLRRLTPHTDITKLPELCDAILEDFQSLASKSSQLSLGKAKLH